MAIDPSKPRPGPAPDVAPDAAPDTVSGTDAADYPALFRTLLVRSVESAYASIDPQAPRLEDDARERSLYALSLALDLDDAWPPAATLLLTLAPHMEMQGYWSDWLEFLDRALGRAEAAHDLRTAARIHLHIGMIRQGRNEYAAADAHFAQCRQLAEAAGDERTGAKAIDRQAVSAVEQTDLPRARALATEAIRRLGTDDPGSAAAYSVLGLIAVRRGEWEEAINHYTRSRDLHVRGGNPETIMQATNNLALTYRYAGRHQEARMYLESALKTLNTVEKTISSFMSIGSMIEQAKAQMNLGVEYWYLAEYEKALECYNRCESVFVQTGQRVMIAILANNRGLAYLRMGDYARAEQEFAGALALVRPLDDHMMIAKILESWGGLHLQAGNADKAASLWIEALSELDALPEAPQYLRSLIAGGLRNLGRMDASLVDNSSLA